MALFSHKQQDDTPVLFGRERQLIAQLNDAARQWLGPRYAWYKKIRNADKGGLAHLLQGQNLEELMQATRSALTLVSKTLNSGLVLAFNSTLDAVSGVNAAPEEWPAKIDMPDRNNPPVVGIFEDALIIAYLPTKFLNLAKLVREKGKGIDFYADGLVKKLQFKVLAYYSDPANWNLERLGFMFTGFDADTELAEINTRLSMLKSELELLVPVLQMFRFGGAHRNRAQSGIANTLEDTFNISDEELVQDLYFQSLLINGMVSFLFRYYIALLSLAPNPRATKVISHIFMPALEKAMEVRLVFQGSFSMERDKIRLRPLYQEYFKQREALPPLELQTVKGREVRTFNYSHKLFDMTAFAFTPAGIERYPKPWQALLQNAVLKHADSPQSPALLLELLNAVVRMMGFASEGKHRVSAALRALADEEEKLGKHQMQQKKKALDTQIAAKKKSSRHFKVLEQGDMAETVTKEAEQMQVQATADLAKMDEAINKRRAAKIKVAEHLDTMAREEKESGMGESAAALYKLLAALDTGRAFHSAFLGFLLQQIKEENDEVYRRLYLHLFAVMPDLTPMEKMVTRKAIAGPLGLEEGEMALSAEEIQVYNQELHSLEAKLEQDVPGLMQYRLLQGVVQATIKALLELGVTTPSLQVLLQLPLQAPHKPPAKLPAGVVKQLLVLNQLRHPFAEHDLLLPNVEATAPPSKRLNVARLGKLLG